MSFQIKWKDKCRANVRYEKWKRISEEKVRDILTRHLSVITLEGNMHRLNNWHEIELPLFVLRRTPSEVTITQGCHDDWQD